MSTSSSSAAERDFKREFLKIIFLVFAVLLIGFSIFFLNHKENNKYIIKTSTLWETIDVRDYGQSRLTFLINVQNT